MLKKIIAIICLISIYNIWFAQDLKWTCAYISEYNQCKSAIKKWTSRTIEDFICVNSRSNEEIMLQIILDKEFKKIDKKIESSISLLEQNKDYYFWANSKKSFLTEIDALESEYSLYWKYWKQYLELCNPYNKKSILAQTIWCFWNEMSQYRTSDYFDEQNCQRLVQTKLEVYKQVSYDILKLNKSEVLNNSTTLVTQDQRTKYDSIIDLFMINLWYLERIWKKWPSKTKNAQ